MNVKIHVKVTVGNESTYRNIDMDWWDQMSVEDIANDIYTAISNIE